MARLVLDELDSTTIQLIVIKLVHSPLHVSPGGKLHDPFIPPVLVSIRVGDVASFSHEVLQVLLSPISHTTSEHQI